MKTINSRLAAREIRGAVLTLGNFDGVHLGHQRIIRKVVGRAKVLRCASAVFTFEPHPLKVVSPGASPPLIAAPEEKIKLIAGLGPNFLILAKFTKGFAEKHPREFVEEFIVPMDVKEVWVGHDFSFGKGKAGTVSHLKSLGAELGFKVNMIPACKKDGHIVSSSRIRALVKSGEVKKAARLLGRGFSVKGVVVRGKRTGRALGFPTANIKVKSELVPGKGVYAAYVFFSGNTYRAAVNVGTAPTLGVVPLCVEAHLLDFKGNIYGKIIAVEFVKRLRDETGFASKEALVKMIARDVSAVRKTLSRG
ncbi:MAG: bifunctional riboflavin kinase/FAD synthetase [Deltaproteobacteria bacterium]|nr:bifunctional riboflavin kinase/FAD synthetase [Deltaproteobacteria bacterium]